MKEKYFGTIKMMGVLLIALTFLGCIIPYVGYLSDGGVGAPHTIVSYYKLKMTDELKSSSEAGKEIYDILGEEKFTELVNTASEVIREQKIYKWDKKTKAKSIPELIKKAGETIGGMVIEKILFEKFFENIMEKDTMKVYRNWTNESLNVSPDVNNEFYTSLVMMSLAFFVSIYSVLKYGKESKIGLAITGFVAALLGAVACLCNEIRLANYLKDVTWPDGARVWTIGPFIAGMVYGLLLIYATAVVVIEIKGSMRIGQKSIRI